MKKEGTLLLSDYAAQIAPTDVLGRSDFSPVLQGLYGEVGGIMTTAKKHVREQSAFPGFRKAAEEEFGDTLWYLAAICRRLDVPLEEVFAEAANHGSAPFTWAGSPGFPGGAGCSDGDGSTGGLSLPLSRRSVSICCTSRLGLVADTGTKPDSAPQ